jgi:hypothetical protein
MLFNPACEGGLDRLGDRLRLAPSVTVDLISAVIASACTRLPAMAKAGKARRLSQLIEIAAWSDAVLALIEIEIPAWRLRRLVHEDGEWHCSLSRAPNLPVELDETADGSHEVLGLAMLSAFLAARHRVSAASETEVRTVPQVRPTLGYPICCDNFA